MLTIIHGQDQGKSRLYLRQLLSEKNREIIIFDGKKLTFNELFSACESLPLISEDKIIVIENFFQAKKSSEKTSIQKYIFDGNLMCQIIIWENKEIEKIKLKSASPETKVVNISYPDTIFKFLDQLFILSVKDRLLTFRSLLKSIDSEVIFSMIVRQFRLMIMVKEAKDNILELPDWQFYKFRNQARLIDLNTLILNYRKLLQLDSEIKNGITPFKKDELIDIFLVNL